MARSEAWVSHLKTALIYNALVCCDRGAMKLELVSLKSCRASNISCHVSTKGQEDPRLPNKEPQNDLLHRVPAWPGPHTAIVVQY